MNRGIRAQLRTLVLGACAVAVAFGAFAPGQAAAAQTNPYPTGKSTHWAWQNRPDLPANLGEAKDWDDNARAQGWPVSEYPRKGAIAVFEPGVLGADVLAGQVAVVEQVLQDGNYVASQTLDGDCAAGSARCGQVHKRTYPVAPGTSFIHYGTDTRTTWGFASGQSGWTTKDLLPGNYGGPGWYYPLGGPDPQLVSPELDVPLDFTYNAVEVDMVTGSPVADPSVQVYFATQDHPTFDESRSVTVLGSADGELHRYRFYFGRNAAWKGKLVRLRLDPAGGGTMGGIRIDRVRLVQVEVPGTQSAASSGGGESNLHGGRRR
ncbi:MAG TPA: CHAP domain-containing protein [Chloroflexia bacterium]|nr:CHAP domain-containing protein [Chloroflexia bacterium]